VTGSVTAGGGSFSIPVSPNGSSKARFVRNGDCEFQPGGVGPWSGKGAITGNITPEGAVTLSSSWGVGPIKLSGRWSGNGSVGK
jgi:hypothetical protein